MGVAVGGEGVPKDGQEHVSPGLRGPDMWLDSHGGAVAAGVHIGLGAGLEEVRKPGHARLGEVCGGGDRPVAGPHGIGLPGGEFDAGKYLGVEAAVAADRAADRKPELGVVGVGPGRKHDLDVAETARAPRDGVCHPVDARAHFDGSFAGTFRDPAERVPGSGPQGRVRHRGFVVELHGNNHTTLSGAT